MATSSEPEYRQIWLTRGGDRLGIQLYPHPDRDTALGGPDDPAVPLVVLWPGMGVPAGYYRPFIQRLREHGLRVAAVDLRGTGASEPRPSRRSRYGYAELTRDVGAVLDELVPDSTQGSVVLLGHSLGGQACLLHLGTTDDKRVAGLALVAVGMPYWRVYCGWRRLAVLPFTQAIGATSAALGVWPGWGFGGRQSKGVIRDWAYTGRTGRFPSIDGLDVTAALREVRTPVLAASVDHDQFTPASTIDRVCALLESAPVEREHYSASVTGRVDHFRWARTPGPMADRVARFARSVISD